VKTLKIEGVATVIATHLEKYSKELKPFNEVEFKEFIRFLATHGINFTTVEVDNLRDVLPGKVATLRLLQI